MKDKKRTPGFQFTASIQTRLIAFMLGLTLLSVIAIGALAATNTLNAGRSAEEKSSASLRGQVEDYLVRLTSTTANLHNQEMERVRQQAGNVAQYAANIFDNPEAFVPEGYWQTEYHMYFGSEGQYINSEHDKSTVFIPNSVDISDKLKTDLELTAYMDFIFEPVLNNTPNAVAIYIITPNEISRLYPNINLGAILPSDYQPTKDIFYTAGTPENNPNRKIVFTPIYDDPAGQGLLVSAIAPIYSRNDKFLGIIGIDISLASLTSQFGETRPVYGGYSLLIDHGGRAIALPREGYQDLLGREPEPGEYGADMNVAISEFTPVMDKLKSGSTGFESVEVGGKEVFIAYAPLKSIRWSMASVAPAYEMLKAVPALQSELQKSTQTFVFERLLPYGLVIFILVIVTGILLSNRLVDPIRKLAAAVQKVGGGAWDTPLPKAGKDELGVLTRSFATMTTQLRDLFEGLEQRVAERTRDLALSAEVGRSVSQVRDLDSLLAEAVNVIRQRFDLYYTQVYLLDSSEENLVLQAGTGEVGQELLQRRHSLPADIGSINGTAAVEKHAMIVSDTEASEVFRPNPLLPETRSEMAVPLMVGERVVGVLDMQSSQPGAFSEDNLPAFQALAGQVAIAISNASLFAQAERARQEIEAQSRRLVREGWEDYLNAIEHSETIAYAYDQETVAPLAEAPQMTADKNTLVTPIQVSGQELGAFQFEGKGGWTHNDADLVETVARLVSQQIENLRLFARAERYRSQAEHALRRLTREGWDSYSETFRQPEYGFIYDLNNVLPLADQKNGDEPIATVQPLKVQDEVIGSLEIAGLENLAEEDKELIAEVTEQLSAHLENLRLFEQTQTALVEVQTTSQALQKSQMQLSEAMDIANMANWELDMKTLIFTWNDKLYSMLGTTAELEKGYEMPADQFVEQFVHPEDAPVFLQTIQKAIEDPVNNPTGALEYRTISRDGQIRHILSEYRVEMDSEGHPLRGSGSHLDITQRKKAEETLAKRATEMAAIANISTDVSSLREPEQILQTVVNQTKENFNLYHAHIYLLNEIGEVLDLAAGAGEVGQQMVSKGWHIPIDHQHSLVARAARMHQGVIVNDVRSEPDFMPNELLPETRSELAVPLIIGNKVLGVLDVQSDEPDHFSQEDVYIQTTLASQVAITLENARTFLQTQRQAEFEAMINAISQKIQSTTSIDNALQVAVRELGRALGSKRTSVHLSIGENDKAKAGLRSDGN